MKEVHDICVLIPTYNSEKYVGMTLASLVAANFKGRVLVADGGSTDKTLIVLEHFYPLLNINIVSDSDKGQSDALNKLLQYVYERYFLWLNSDDLIFPNFFTVFNEAIANDKTEYSFYCANHIEDSFNGQSRLIYGSNQYKVHCKHGIWRGDFPCVIWSTTHVKDVGGLDVELHYNMDQDLVRKLAIASKRRIVGKHVNRFLGIFRIHAESKTTGNTADESLDRVNDYFKSKGILRVQLLYAKFMYYLYSPKLLRNYLRF